MKTYAVHDFYGIHFSPLRSFLFIPPSWLSYEWYSLPNNALESELETLEQEDEMIKKGIVE